MTADARLLSAADLNNFQSFSPDAKSRGGVTTSSLARKPSISIPPELRQECILDVNASSVVLQSEGSTREIISTPSRHRTAEAEERLRVEAEQKRLADIAEEQRLLKLQEEKVQQERLAQEQRLRDKKEARALKLAAREEKKRLFLEQAKKTYDERQLLHEKLLVVVPKVNGSMMVEIRHDIYNHGARGLFVHAFHEGSLATDILREGDELIEVFGIDVAGQQLEALGAILMDSHAEEMEVPMKILRRQVHVSYDEQE